MPKFIFKDAKIYLEGRNLSGELNNIGLEYTAETPERTAFGDNSKRRLPGILNASLSMSGYWDAVSATDSLDADLFAEIAAASGVCSLSPDGGALGDVSYSFQVQAAEYSPGAAHGEVYKFGLTLNRVGPIDRGTVMESSAFASTANGTARQLGAVLATETLYSSIHVVSVSGTNPTLDVILESDDANDFVGSTTRITHPQFTAVGANWQALAGVNTDVWWRYVLTVGGTDTPTFTVFLVTAIQQTLLP